MDFFVLPPSGDLYAYPSEMSDTDQASFVENTERDCLLLSTNASVAWEFTGTWERAVEQYFPRYNNHSIAVGFFAVNVPFLAPILNVWNNSMGQPTFYRIIGEDVVLFKPREWRGIGTGTPMERISKKEYLTVAEMADELNTYPKGTVSHIYLTSDGGGNLDMLYDLVALLDNHVQVVNHKALISMAIQRGRD